MPNGEKVRRERNWYKVATLILSVAMIGIMFVSGIYYKRVEKRDRRVAKVQERIGKLLERKKELERVPKVEVEVLTLKESGLPEFAFESLNEVPGVVCVRHGGGETAIGITVQVKSSAEIVRYIPDTSVEGSSYRISKDKRSLTLEIPRLRRNSVIQGTIMSSGIGSMSFNERIDKGILLDQKEAAEGIVASPFRFSDLEALDVGAFSSVRDVEDAVARLRLLSKEETQTQWSPLTGGLVAALVSVLGAFVIMVISLTVIYFRGRQSHELGKLIMQCKDEGLIQVGMAKEKVREILGVAEEVSTKLSEGVPSEEWVYKPRPSFFHSRRGGSQWEPDMFVNFKDGKVTSFEYKEYGERSCSEVASKVSGDITASGGV